MPYHGPDPPRARQFNLLLSEVTMYVYIQSEPYLFTVGFYAPNGEWHPDSDYASREEAAKRVSYLNGRGE